MRQARVAPEGVERRRAPRIGAIGLEPERKWHLHVHYGESVVAVRDGLPKPKDMPKEMGGSGTLLAD